MRPLPAVTALLVAAILGAGASRWLDARQGPPGPGPAPAPAAEAGVLEQAADLALPPVAQAALPSQIAGVPVPSLAPMLEKVTPAVVNVYSRQTVRVRNPIAEFFGMPGGMPQERIQQSL